PPELPESAPKTWVTIRAGSKQAALRAGTIIAGGFAARGRAGGGRPPFSDDDAQTILPGELDVERLAGPASGGTMHRPAIGGAHNRKAARERALVAVGFEQTARPFEAARELAEMPPLGTPGTDRACIETPAQVAASRNDGP